MSNPIDDYFEFRKTAAYPFGGFGKQVADNIGHGAADALGAGAVAGGAAVLGVAAMKVYRAVTKKRDFEQMLQHSPDLRQYQEQQPELFNAHYSSLRSMMPRFAADPIVAGSIMRQMSLSPHTAGGALLGVMGDYAKSGPSGKLTAKGVGDASFNL